MARGDVDAVRRDLLKGVSPNQTDERQTPLLITAVAKGHLAVVELLKAGAVVDGVDPSAHGVDVAAERDDVDAVQLLLARNPRVNL